jgi:3',5'-cyclic AMP phosphodiesterase CpdA
MGKSGLLVMAVLVMLVGCSSSKNIYSTSTDKVQIAFLADIHLHDIYGELTDQPDSAITDRLPKDSGNNAPLLMRSMQAQLTSTRLYNENYFVLKAALDDIAQRGITLVALPGDFTDDGQPINVRAVARILDDYHRRFGMRFFTITGNHDPVRPFTRESGKKDFLDKQGNEIGVYSEQHPKCKAHNATICSDQLKAWGYVEIMDTLSAHGFSQHIDDIYYETPFDSHGGMSNVNRQRGWQWCNDNQHCVLMPDASYLVEPVKDVWLLAIDANVYIPEGDLSEGKFNGSGNAGYNALLTYKPALLSWVKDVVQRAKAQNKRLVAFSHFPMADFYDDTQADIEAVFGPNTMQLARMPSHETTQALAATGLVLHMAGHMHLFDIAHVNKPNSAGLVNVQVPSLAAYQPGYSLVTLLPHKQASVETIVIDQVPDFTRLFSHYETEWQSRDKAGLENWDRALLSAETYLAFTDYHLKNVVSKRYLPQEWPAKIVTLLNRLSLQQLLTLTGCDIPNELTTNEPATTLAYDYYRLRNAGQFANLHGRDGLYNYVNQQMINGQCAALEQDEGGSVIRAIIRLLVKTNTAEDAISIVVDGV